MKKMNGSMTVEAAIMIPMLLFLVASAIDGGVEMYLESQNSVLSLEKEEKIDVVELFYLCNVIGDRIGNEDSLY